MIDRLIDQFKDSKSDLETLGRLAVFNRSHESVSKVLMLLPRSGPEYRAIKRMQLKLHK